LDKLKDALSANIAALRQNARLSQAELAERLSYSDKSISKWERGEGLPDIYVIKQIAEMFDVTVDYLLVKHSPSEKPETRGELARRNHKFISVISLFGIILAVTIAFTAVWAATGKAAWVMYVVCVPVCFAAAVVFNTLWFKKRNNLYIISALIWTLLAAVYVSLLALSGRNLWLIFVVGVPAQIVTALCFGIVVTGRKK